jgi:hypothetical protein
MQEILSLSEPLKHTFESDWLVTQIDIGYDIPHSAIIANAKGPLSFTEFNGSLKVKHLDAVYQIYNKLLPDKGSYLRLEKQVSFSSSSHSSPPTLPSLPSVIVPPSPEDILNTVFGFTSPPPHLL